MAAETALVTLPTTNLAEVFTDRGLNPIIKKIRDEVMSIVPDISTEKGRKEIASLARKVASSKVALDDLGKGLTEDAKARIKVVDAERKRMRDELDALRDEVRKPLTDWEQKDEQRVKGHQDAMAEIERMGLFSGEPNSTDLKQRLDRLQSFKDRQWDEFEEMGKVKHQAIQNMLEKMHAGSVTREANEAELKRLREAEKQRLEEEAKRRSEERVAELQREAAERAKKEAEEKAQRDKIEAEQKAKREAERLEHERKLAEERALKAEAEAKAAAERAEAAKKAAEEKAQRDKEAAVEAERQRAEDEKKAEAKAAALREANLEHRKKINNAALAEIVAILRIHRTEPAAIANITLEGVAQSIIEAIARGKVPHVTIAY